MDKTALFNIIINQTAEVCGVSVDDIMNGKRTHEVVNARCIVVNCCRHFSMTNMEILLQSGRRNVNSITSIVATQKLRYRGCPVFRSMYDGVCKRVYELTK